MGQALKGITIIDTIRPKNTQSTYPTHESIYGKGGWQEVSSIIDRNNIMPDRRTNGMAVFVTSEQKLYTLSAADITVTPLLDSDWIEFKTTTDGEYLALTGGTVNGSISANNYFFNDSTNITQLSTTTIKTLSGNDISSINYDKTNAKLYIYKYDGGYYETSIVTSTSTVTSDDYLPLSGGKVNGNISANNYFFNDGTNINTLSATAINTITGTYLNDKYLALTGGTINGNLIISGILNTSNIMLNNHQLNTSGGLITVGTDGKILSTLYDKGMEGSYLSANNPTGTGTLTIDGINISGSFKGYGEWQGNIYNQNLQLTSSHIFLCNSNNNDNIHTQATDLFQVNIGLLNQVSGLVALAHGKKNIVNGQYSFVQGYNNTVSGNYSHGEGLRTVIMSNTSHVEGLQTSGMNYYTHAEGENTKALGEGSHSEGNSSTASGNTSHAEGTSNNANGISSHAEGKQTNANGNYSHSEGAATLTIGEGSHSEGKSTSAVLSYSHAEGYKSITNGNYSHAEGSESVTSGYAAHAEGNQTKAVGQGSHSEGNNNIASGLFSHAEGLNTTSKGKYSHTEGQETIADGQYTHAEGINTYAGPIENADASTAEGAHAEGKRTKAYNTASHAEGFQTSTSENYQHVEGRWNQSKIGFQKIVGGGTSDSDRKNIYTLDWNGNEWISGTLSASNFVLNNHALNTSGGLVQLDLSGKIPSTILDTESFGKIDKIKVNGIQQPISTTDKSVDLNVIEQPENSSVGQYLRKTASGWQTADGIATIQQSISSVIDNKIQVKNTSIPVMLKTNKGNFYPIQKTTLTQVDNYFYIDISGYLIYDNSSSFTGTWTVYFGAGVAQRNTNTVITGTITNNLYNANYNLGDIHVITASANTQLLVSNIPVGDGLSIRLNNVGNNSITFANNIEILNLSGNYIIPFGNIIGQMELIGGVIKLNKQN